MTSSLRSPCFTADSGQKIPALGHFVSERPGGDWDMGVPEYSPQLLDETFGWSITTASTISPLDVPHDCDGRGQPGIQ